MPTTTMKLRTKFFLFCCVMFMLCMAISGARRNARLTTELLALRSETLMSDAVTISNINRMSAQRLTVADVVELSREKHKDGFQEYDDHTGCFFLNASNLSVLHKQYAAHIKSAIGLNEEVQRLEGYPAFDLWMHDRMFTTRELWTGIDSPEYRSELKNLSAIKMPKATPADQPDYEQEYAVLVKTNAKPTSVDVTFKPTPACWAVFYEYAATTGSGKGFAWYQVTLKTPDDLKQLINLVRSDVYAQNTNVVSVMIVNLVKLDN